MSKQTIQDEVKPEGQEQQQQEESRVKGAPSAPEDAGRLSPEQVKAAEEVAAKAEAKEEAAQKAEEAASVEYVDIGDPAGQAAINKLKAAGVSAVEANAIFAEAIEANDLDKVDWQALKNKVSADDFVLIKAGVEQFYAGSYQELRKTVDYGHNAVGGEENWEKVRKWANTKEKSDAGFKAKLDGIRNSISANGYQAQMAIDTLKKLYEADPKNSSLTFQMEHGNTKPVAMGEPMTRRQYVDALEEAHKKGGPGLEAAIAQLGARRQAGMARGI